MIISPKPAMYADVPIPIPLTWVGYNSPAKGKIIKNEADIADFDTKYKTNVVLTSSKNKY